MAMRGSEELKGSAEVKHCRFFLHRCYVFLINGASTIGCGCRDDVLLVEVDHRKRKR